jgi:hypothetical protein
MPSRPRSDEPRAIIEEAFKYACANGRIAVAQHFLDSGVNIDAPAHRHGSALGPPIAVTLSW